MSTSTSTFLDTISKRRTYYALGAESPISDTRIQEIIRDVLLRVPSAFNSQTTRVVLLANDDHRKLWSITKEVLQPVVPADQFAATDKKLDNFKAAYGTVLFFDDKPTILEYQQKFTLYADKIQDWAVQSNGMHQFSVWTALEEEGLGANLQHYNPLIDERVREEWDLPTGWALSGQLVFGKPLSEPNAKSFKPVEERFKAFGV